MTAVLAKFDYTYTHGGKTISFKNGDKFSLVSKVNADWWHVKRSSGFEELYVPVLYVEEVAENSSFTTQSLDRIKKTSHEKIEIPIDNEVIYDNLRPAPPPPETKERTPQPKERTPQPNAPEKNITLPRTPSGSTFGVGISPQEFPENPASPPLVSPIRSTPSPPFVPPKPVTRAASSDRLLDSHSPATGPPPVKARTLSTYKKKNRHASASNTLDDPGEASTFVSKSLSSSHNSLPVNKPSTKVNRTISAEVNYI